MPRRPRIDLAGYHHIINRGVNRSDIFNDHNDYEMFLKILCKACTAYRASVHDYCLMSNHFHLLVETKLDNLSLFMKHINSNYAIYFNKKNGRSGHFWQGRFYSRYITSDEYYYTLIRYIEFNPIEAGISTQVGAYPYTLGATLINQNEIIPCARDSKLISEFHYENIQEIIGTKLNEDDLEILEKIQQQKVIIDENHFELAFSKTLAEHFKEKETIEKRNSAIISAIKDGYTQAQIAKQLSVSRSLISKVIKGVFSTPDP
jgi:REP element-mobilizing transposase RayT